MHLLSNSIFSFAVFYQNRQFGYLLRLVFVCLFDFVFVCNTEGEEEEAGGREKRGVGSLLK